MSDAYKVQDEQAQLVYRRALSTYRDYRTGKINRISERLQNAIADVYLLLTVIVRLESELARLRKSEQWLRDYYERTERSHRDRAKSP